MVGAKFFVAVGKSHVDVRVFEPEPRVDVRGHFGVGFDDVLDVGVDEVVEGVDVLFDEAFDFEEGGEEEPFVLGRALVSVVGGGRGGREGRESAPRRS